jgi:hypothetical protein
VTRISPPPPHFLLALEADARFQAEFANPDAFSKMDLCCGKIGRTGLLVAREVDEPVVGVHGKHAGPNLLVADGARRTPRHAERAPTLFQQLVTHLQRKRGIDQAEVSEAASSDIRGHQSCEGFS